jgi:hypothetical protein
MNGGADVGLRSGEAHLFSTGSPSRSVVSVPILAAFAATEPATGRAPVGARAAAPTELSSRGAALFVSTGAAPVAAPEVPAGG